MSLRARGFLQVNDGGIVWVREPLFADRLSGVSPDEVEFSIQDGQVVVTCRDIEMPLSLNAIDHLTSTVPHIFIYAADEGDPDFFSFVGDVSLSRDGLLELKGALKYARART